MLYLTRHWCLLQLTLKLKLKCLLDSSKCGHVKRPYHYAHLPERGHFWVVQCGWKGPILQVVGPWPGPGTHLSQPTGHSYPLPCRLHHGRSGPERSERKWTLGVNLLCSCLELDLKGHSHFICHDGCHGASNFMILLCLSIWAQKNEKEPDICQEMS